jgi:hypothetical protein
LTKEDTIMPLSSCAWVLATVIAAPVLNLSVPPINISFTGDARLSILLSVAGALRRLEVPSCRRVLGDFTDDGGRSLADRLDATGLTLAEYVSQLDFVDGDGKQACTHGTDQRVHGAREPRCFSLLKPQHGLQKTALFPSDRDPRNPAYAGFRRGSAFERTDYTTGDGALRHSLM